MGPSTTMYLCARTGAAAASVSGVLTVAAHRGWRHGRATPQARHVEIRRDVRQWIEHEVTLGDSTVRKRQRLGSALLAADHQQVEIDDARAPALARRFTAEFPLEVAQRGQQFFRRA